METGVNKSLYEEDFYLWIETTVKFLKERQFSEVDFDNLIEEIESMGKSDKSALRSNLIIVMMHLLKYKYQNEKRSNSWLVTIFEHRRRLKETFEDSPSLKPYFLEVFDKCYKNAQKQAALETGLPMNTFPNESPFTPEEALDSEYLPE